MIELFSGNLMNMNRPSSKGNQLKWREEENWYKADSLGYEGLAEYCCSQLLRFSNLRTDEFSLYETETITYKHRQLTGCRSRNFLPTGWQLLTLERLFKNARGISLYESIFRIRDVPERLSFLVNETVRLTGLTDFGTYLTKALTMDALFLNEDRHMHNLAVLLTPEGSYHYCPYFDMGAALLSDTSLDYPMGNNLQEMISEVRAKTVCDDFAEALDCAEALYGTSLRFNFNYEDVVAVLNREFEYPKAAKDRVLQLIMEMRRRYAYLFDEN